MKPTKLILIVLLAAVATVGAFAQDPVVNLQQGYKPYDSYHGGEFDAVSITNGNLNVNIPLLSYPQRGGALELAWKIAYTNRSWAEEQYQVSQSPPTTATWWQWHGQGVQPVMTKGYGQNSYKFTVPPPSGDAGDVLHIYTLYEADGTSHALDMRSGPLGGLQYTMDGSGLKVNAGTGFYVLDSKGAKYTPSNWTDANGNQITFNSSTITDTM